MLSFVFGLVFFFFSGFAAYFIYRERKNPAAMAIFVITPLVGVYFLEWAAIAVWLFGMWVGLKMAMEAGATVEDLIHEAIEEALPEEHKKKSANTTYERAKRHSFPIAVIVAVCAWPLIEKYNESPFDRSDGHKLNQFQKWRYQECRNDAAKNPTPHGVRAAMIVCEERFIK